MEEQREKGIMSELFGARPRAEYRNREVRRAGNN